MIGFALRPHFVSQVDGLLKEDLKHLPGELMARFGDRAAMHRFGVGPQTVASGMFEKFPRFGIEALAFATHGNRQDEGDESRQG